MSTPKYWIGSPRVTCDVCHAPLAGAFSDASVGGPWACVCDACFVSNNCSYGVGRGQRYELTTSGKWLQVAVPITAVRIALKLGKAVRVVPIHPRGWSFVDGGAYPVDGEQS